MNELIKKILEENLEARQKSLLEIDTVAENVEIKKAEYDEALTKLADLGDVEILKTKLIAEIAEIENELFPKSNDADDSAVDTDIEEEV